jgi:hypothetical protein
LATGSDVDEAGSGGAVVEKDAAPDVVGV